MRDAGALVAMSKFDRHRAKRPIRCDDRAAHRTRVVDTGHGLEVTHRFGHQRDRHRPALWGLGEHTSQEAPTLDETCAEFVVGC